ncbi:MAG TPA: hypothetical protein PKV35_08230, partial [bacterium]|nr:hypothetical protein [bacterium]
KDAGGNSKKYTSSTINVSGGAAVESLSILKYKTGSCGGSNVYNSAGGKGGGAIILYGANITVEGTLSAKGGNGISEYYGGSGGGSGGSITLFGGMVDLKSSADLNVDGGTGGTSGYSSNYHGGAGSKGMIKILSGQKSAGIIDPLAKVGSYNVATVAPPDKMS